MPIRLFLSCSQFYQAPARRSQSLFAAVVAGVSLGFANPGVLANDKGIEIAQRNGTSVASNGNSVRRVRDSLFRIYVRDYHANWFSTLDCTEIQWPIFRCKDGIQRVMKVIDASSIRFGEQEYFRAVAQVKQ